MTGTRLAEVQLLESERRLGQEMTEIGKELHDNLSQILGAAKMYIELAKTDEENRELCLNKASTFLVTVIEALRKISKNLMVPGKIIVWGSPKIVVQEQARDVNDVTFLQDGVTIGIG